MKGKNIREKRNQQRIRNEAASVEAYSKALERDLGRKPSPQELDLTQKFFAAMKSGDPLGEAARLGLLQ